MLLLLKILMMGEIIQRATSTRDALRIIGISIDEDQLEGRS